MKTVGMVTDVAVLAGHLEVDDGDVVAGGAGAVVARLGLARGGDRGDESVGDLVGVRGEGRSGAIRQAEGDSAKGEATKAWGTYESPQGVRGIVSLTTPAGAAYSPEFKTRARLQDGGFLADFRAKTPGSMTSVTGSDGYGDGARRGQRPGQARLIPARRSGCRRDRCEDEVALGEFGAGVADRLHRRPSPPPVRACRRAHGWSGTRAGTPPSAPTSRPGSTTGWRWHS